jgi:hypothetical protein
MMAPKQQPSLILPKEKNNPATEDLSLRTEYSTCHCPSQSQKKRDVIPSKLVCAAAGTSSLISKKKGKKETLWQGTLSTRK